MISLMDFTWVQSMRVQAAFVTGSYPAAATQAIFSYIHRCTFFTGDHLIQTFINAIVVSIIILTLSKTTIMVITIRINVNMIGYMSTVFHWFKNQNFLHINL